ncbi:aldehyde dehydrogenase family protein [Nocardia higoensis]|uniref:aldehyde dehydrogenase family protein n=1 Tax=Nocardia higoensis TaxID=228599 RepID=UPI0003117E2B|nr:aldehyde dehydrogenase family protein [Nocardia higoensis]
MTTTTSVGAVDLRHYVGGRWEEGGAGPLVSTNPARPDEIVAAGREATAADVDRSVSAARAAARAWARTPVHERGAILIRAAAGLEAEAAPLGRELAREEGKTLAEGTGEVLRAAQILRYYGNEGDRVAGEVFASPRRGERILVTRKPLGVVGVITPFNFPIAIPAWKIAPALVYGNTVVWKPSGVVPLLAVRLTEALADAGLPEGVLNLVIGAGELGTAIVNHPGIDGITFTGSTTIGRRIAAAGAGCGVPVQAEMGGKNAAVVLADADLDLAAEQVLFGAFRSTGQKCTATSRLILQDAVADEFLDRLRARLDDWIVGDPTDPSVHMGPVVSETARRDIRAGVSRSLAEGATLLIGDQDVPESGYFVPATVLELPSDPVRAAANTAWSEEFFGPVLSVRRAADAASAFALVDESEFGLSASVFTQDVTRALDAVEDIDVGILHINSESAGADPHVPFGGAKKSGYGPKEQGGAAKEFFTHTTTVYLRGGTPA